MPIQPRRLRPAAKLRSLSQPATMFDRLATTAPATSTVESASIRP
jgi:hypothetical protein